MWYVLQLGVKLKWEKSNKYKEVLLPKAKGPPGPGGHNNLTRNALEDILYFISTL